MQTRLKNSGSESGVYLFVLYVYIPLDVYCMGYKTTFSNKQGLYARPIWWQSTFHLFCQLTNFDRIGIRWHMYWIWKSKEKQQQYFCCMMPSNYLHDTILAWHMTINCPTSLLYSNCSHKGDKKVYKKTIEYLYWTSKKLALRAKFC